jgi:uncharacterized membrane protein
MNKLFYIIIGFILGIVVTLYLYIQEYLGKVTWKSLKKLWKILNE